MSTTDARKLLAASRKSRRITSPYASYSLAGALFCNICSNTPIKSESLWDAHIASSQHKSNVAIRGGTVSTGKTNSHKRPAESPAIDNDSRNRRSGDDGQTASKRLKTAKADVKNLALPVGFFDEDEDEDEEGIISTGEVIEPDDENSPPPPPPVQNTNQQQPTTALPSSSTKLPADFFSTTSTSKTKGTEGSLDDEWAAFQADIAEAEEEIALPNVTATANHTISAPALTTAQLQQEDEESASSLDARNARTIAEEEMEDARAALADFFDEQSSLEERVARLKERREMLRQVSTTVPTGMPPPPTQGLHRSNSVRSVTMGGMDDYSNPVPELQSEGSDDDYEDDDEMFLRRRLDQYIIGGLYDIPIYPV
ncbi:hypothetical protein TWF970_008274 [Orbilia oligospora]|uniref:Coiled-coil domain-containing protein 16 n=1 Tax=Orbilia oligospora TaxID=2813651 RepID=A0A7C8R698_ORBOL|nr:hypothetical protein TWF970_008274 [Orbilia oligospora]